MGPRKLIPIYNCFCLLLNHYSNRKTQQYVAMIPPAARIKLINHVQGGSGCCAHVLLLSPTLPDTEGSPAAVTSLAPIFRDRTRSPFISAHGLSHPFGEQFQQDYVYRL